MQILHMLERIFLHMLEFNLTGSAKTVTLELCVRNIQKNLTTCHLHMQNPILYNTCYPAKVTVPVALGSAERLPIRIGGSREIKIVNLSTLEHPPVVNNRFATEPHKRT